MSKKYYIYFNCEECGKECQTIKYRYLAQKTHLCRSCSMKKTYKNFSEEKKTNIKEKTRKTNLAKYGVDNPAKNEDIKKKTEQTNIEKYGVKCCLQIEEIHSKGVKEASKKEAREKAKNNTNYKEVWHKAMKTYKNKTGYDHPMKNPEIKKAMIEKYGQIGFVAKYKYDNNLFDSIWELKYYYYLQQNNIKFKFHPKVTFEYFIDGVSHSYQPDFEINGKYYEIKGTQFFNKKGEPYNMYTKSFWWEKYECLLKNNVTILKRKDLEKILQEIDSKIFEKYKI